VVFLSQVFTIGQLSHDLAHGLALELQAVGVVHEAVEDGVCEGVVTDAGIPLVGGQLADHGGGGVAVAIVHDLHEVIALGGLQGFESPVIDNEQTHLGQLRKPLVVAAIGLGLVEFQEQS
jgi:hypothetical protein